MTKPQPSYLANPHLVGLAFAGLGYCILEGGTQTSLKHECIEAAQGQTPCFSLGIQQRTKLLSSGRLGELIGTLGFLPWD